MLKISNSRVKTFRGCHYAHYLKYVEGLTKKQKAGALRRGSAIHECLEAYNSGKSWRKPFKEFKADFYENTFEEERLELGDLPGMVEELMENYAYYYEQVKPEDYEYLYNEFHFELPLTEGVLIEGYIDAIVKDSSGKILTVEHKTYKRDPGRDFIIFNPQSAIYNWALGQLGSEPGGTIWDIIKAKKPSYPTLLKSGKLSKAKLDSTPYSVKKGIKLLGLDPKDYREFIDSHNYESYFTRELIRYNKQTTSSIIEDLINTAKEIRDRGEKLRDKNLGKDCTWCQFKDICQAEILGLDTEYIINKVYEKGGRKNGKKEEETSID